MNFNEFASAGQAFFDNWSWLTGLMGLAIATVLAVLKVKTDFLPNQTF
jgi:hypothetical protein